MTEVAKIAAAVLSNLMLDGTMHQPGAIVALDEAIFEGLVALKVVAATDEKPATAKAPALAADELAAMVKEAIGKLEASDFEADGSPKLSAVQAGLPGVTKGVTKKLVAEAWAVLKAGTATE